jgi:hypothetical protein
MDDDTPLPVVEEQSTIQTPVIDPAKELAAKMFRLRKKVLLRDPDLAALHRSVVIKGKLSEDDFWGARQVSLFHCLVHMPSFKFVSDTSNSI